MMKKLVLSVCIIFAVMACDQQSAGYTITGSIRGEVEDGTQVFLRGIGEDNQPVDVDTTTVENGQFVFKGQTETPEMQYVFIDNFMGYHAVIIENGEIQFSAQEDSLS